MDKLEYIPGDLVMTNEEVGFVSGRNILLKLVLKEKKFNIFRYK